jgi:hypothetical protein
MPQSKATTLHDARHAAVSWLHVRYPEKTARVMPGGVMGETRMYAIGRAILLVLVAFLKSYHPICADDGPVTGVCVAAERKTGKLDFDVG